MAGRGVDIILGGNAEGLARHEAVASGADLDTEEGWAVYEKLLERYEKECGDEGVHVRELGGLYVLGSERHESPPHRQPAPGSFRPSRRRRREPLLLVPRGRAHASLRHRCHAVGDEPDPARRHPHRGEDGDQGHRARPEHRRGPQRRDPQGRPQVRRGPQRAAQGDLRPSAPGDRRRGPAKSSPRKCSRRPSTIW